MEDEGWGMNDMVYILRRRPMASLTVWHVHMFFLTTLIISKKPGNTGISRDIRTEFTTDLLLSD